MTSLSKLVHFEYLANTASKKLYLPKKSSIYVKDAFGTVNKILSRDVYFYNLREEHTQIVYYDYYKARIAYSEAKRERTGCDGFSFYFISLKVKTQDGDLGITFNNDFQREEQVKHFIDHVNLQFKELQEQTAYTRIEGKLVEFDGKMINSGTVMFDPMTTILRSRSDVS